VKIFIVSTLFALEIPHLFARLVTEPICSENQLDRHKSLPCASPEIIFFEAYF
jgi:hypothetical protein